MPMHHATGKKLLGFWDLMSISLGQIIGTGVVVLTGVAPCNERMIYAMDPE